MKIFAVRHGETEWNLARKMQGHRNSPLTAKGLEQARLAGMRLADIPVSAVYSSDLERAFRTADIIRGANSTADIPLIKTPLLREISLGSWEGASIDELKVNQPDAFNSFWKHPETDNRADGESFSDVIERAGNFLESIKLDYAGKNIIVVSHGVFIKSMVAYIDKRPLCDLWSGSLVKSASITTIEYNGSGWMLLSEGDSAHLNSG